MPDKPPAEIAIDEALVRQLVGAQALDVIPDAPTLPLQKVAEGWDSELWRLGDEVAVRLPRREIAATLILNEQRTLTGIAARLAGTGIRVPVPVRNGVPSPAFPWPWSLVPWFGGTSGLGIPRHERTGWARPLAEALLALHTKAPADHPVNPFRGGPLESRSDTVAGRLALLRAEDRAPRPLLDDAERVWRKGLAAASWSEPAVWIHGDLHPGNLVARGSHLVAIVDFGDVTAGDPAYDLAIGWLAFDPKGRADFRGATATHYDEATWVRARAWAVAVATLLLAHSDDNPPYAHLGMDALHAVSEHPGDS